MIETTNTNQRGDFSDCRYQVSSLLLTEGRIILDCMDDVAQTLLLQDIRVVERSYSRNNHSYSAVFIRDK